MTALPATDPVIGPVVRQLLVVAAERERSELPAAANGCIVPGCTCEGPARPDWPMPDSPPFPRRWGRSRRNAFGPGFHHPGVAPDPYIEESLRMAVMGVE